jgi:transposase
MSIRRYVGADIAANSIQLEWVEVSSQQREQLTIQHKQGDYRKVVKRLTQQTAAAEIQVVMEATGSYWMAFAEYLHQAGMVVSVLNPIQSAHFAQMLLQRTKTDRADAHLLCEYGQRLRPDAWTPPPPICQQLQHRLRQRDDLVQIRSAERNRRHALQRQLHVDKSIRQRLEHHIDYLTRQIKILDTEIRQLLLSHHDWKEHVRRLLTLKGLGFLTVAWLLVATHAFSRCETPDQAAAFAGLAPHPRESGQWKGKRSVGGGGHRALRGTLYMASLSAVRFNPRLKSVFAHLLKRGKPKKVALCAIARKLIHLAWALVVKQRDFDPDWNQSLSLP